MAKKASKSAGSKYTQPQLREKLKEEVMAEDKGGKPGQWSARKSQLLAQKYKAQGGGYEGEKGAPQKSIDKWTDENWTTSDGKPARKGATTDRYLPKKAWDDMTESQKKATKKKKQAGSKEGKQFVANTDEAKTSRKKATKKVAKKAGKKKAAKKSVSKKKATKTSPSRVGRPAAKKTAKKATKKAAKKSAKKVAKKTTKKSARSAR